MNWHQHEKSIQKLLHEGIRLSGGKNPNKKIHKYMPGVYVMTQKEHDDQFVKVGMSWGSGGIYQRIKGQYKLCFHQKNEMFLRYCIISPRTKTDGKHTAEVLERKITRSFDTDTVASYSKEWVINAGESLFYSRITDVLRNNRELWTHVVKFSSRGWVTVANDGSSLSGLDRGHGTDVQALKGPRKVLAGGYKPVTARFKEALSKMLTIVPKKKAVAGGYLKKK